MLFSFLLCWLCYIGDRSGHHGLLSLAPIIGTLLLTRISDGMDVADDTMRAYSVGATSATYAGRVKTQASMLYVLLLRLIFVAVPVLSLTHHLPHFLEITIVLLLSSISATAIKGL